MYENEQELFSCRADKVGFKMFRLGTVKVVITDQRIIIKNAFTGNGYPYEDIVSIERIRVMFINFGIRFCLANGKQVTLAARQIGKLVEALRSIGKEVKE